MFYGPSPRSRQGVLLVVLVGVSLFLRPAGARVAGQEAAPAAKTPQNRSPVPDPAKQKEAEKGIKDLFKAEYAKKQPADKQALAKLLLGHAKETQNDLPVQWVLFREAQDLAAQIGDLDLTLDAAESAAAIFDISLQGTRIAALGAAGKTLKTPEDLAKLGDLYLKVVDEALETEDFENADKALAGAAQTSKRLASPPFSTRVAARARDEADQKARYDKVKRSLDALAKDPANPAANLEVGLYHCFVKNAWDTGLPFLAKGSDPVLKTLASHEADHPTEVGAQVELADGWWDLAEKERSDSKQRLLYQRATSWYEKALTASTSLLKTKIETRLDAQYRRILSRDGLEVVFTPKAVSRGIQVCECGDGLYEPATIGGKPSVKLIRANVTDFSRYLYLKLTETWQESWKGAEVEVEYFDDGPGPFDIQYDGVPGPYCSTPKKVVVGTSKSWKTATFPIPDPMFRGRENAGADLRIGRTPGTELYIHRVTVRLAQK